MSTTAPQAATMITPDEALALVIEHTPAPRTQCVDLKAAAGRVLAETVRADRDYPPFDRVMMDGFAIRLTDAGRTVRVVGEASPGAAWRGRLCDGEAVSIMTGAPSPEGTEAIVPVEQARILAEGVKLPASISAGQHIAPRGSDCADGETVAEPGLRLTPLALAGLATVGASRPRVYAHPRAAIISTGNELLDAGAMPDLHQIRDSNSVMVAAIMQSLGIDAIAMHRATDSAEAIIERVEACEDCELIILTGGVSAGRYDLIPQVVSRMGWRIVFHKVAQKPGKPLLFAVREGRLLFGLPGNPLAAQVGAQRYVAAAVRAMCGRRPEPLGGEACLTEAVHNRGARELFVLSRVTTEETGWTIRPLKGSGSADVFSSQKANAFLRAALGEELSAGERGRFEWLASAGMEGAGG